MVSVIGLGGDRENQGREEHMPALTPRRISSWSSLWVGGVVEVPRALTSRSNTVLDAIARGFKPHIDGSIHSMCARWSSTSNTDMEVTPGQDDG